MLNAIFTILDFLVDLLPSSPFFKVQTVISQRTWLAYMNWIIPIDQMIAIFNLYCTALVAFLLWSQRHSYVKLIKNLVTKFFNLFDKK